MPTVYYDGGLTEWYVVVGLDWNIMLNLNVVYPFEDAEPMPDAVDAHFFEFVML